MAKKLGQLHNEPLVLEPIYMFQTEEQEKAREPKIMMMPERHFLKPFLGDQGWYDFSLTLKPDPKRRFIAVRDDGWIMSAERDPTMITVTGVDIWQIEHSGEQMDLIGHRWTGKEVVPWDAS